MVLLSLAFVILFSSAVVLFLHHLTQLQLSQMQGLLENQRQDHQAEKNRWELERERLLNRCMTKEWTNYTQMQSQMAVSSSTSDPPKGMSDEEELQRYGLDPGVGEAAFPAAEQELADLFGG